MEIMKFLNNFSKNVFLKFFLKAFCMFIKIITLVKNVTKNLIFLKLKQTAHTKKKAAN